MIEDYEGIAGEIRGNMMRDVALLTAELKEIPLTAVHMWMSDSAISGGYKLVTND